MADTLNWDDLVGCTAGTDGTLTKTAPDSPFAYSGAVSIATIPGDGWVEFTYASAALPGALFGLTAEPNPGPNWTSPGPDFAFWISSTTNLVKIWEGGAGFEPVAAPTAVDGDVFKVLVTSDTVEYYLNGVLFYTSLVTATHPLLGYASILPSGGKISAPTIYGHQRTVQFTDTSTTDTTSWLWLFGDASTSTSQNPTHAYVLDGTYTVTLFATSAKGTSTYVGEVVILNGLLESFTPGELVPTPGGDPQVMLRISNDGGKTWVAEVWRDAGKVGEYLRRVRWNRLGAARRRVFEIAVTDPIQWRITGAYIETEPGDA